MPQVNEMSWTYLSMFLASILLIMHLSDFYLTQHMKLMISKMKFLRLEELI